MMAAVPAAYIIDLMSTPSSRCLLRLHSPRCPSHALEDLFAVLAGTYFYCDNRGFYCPQIFGKTGRGFEKFASEQVLPRQFCTRPNVFHGSLNINIAHVPSNYGDSLLNVFFSFLPSCHYLISNPSP